MRTFTLVTDALVPVGRGKAMGAAARGRNLVLLGDMRSVLEELASELRVVHSVDVRILAVDLAEPDGAEQVLGWLDEREIELDAMIAVRWSDADPVRAQQMSRQLARLESVIEERLVRRGLPGVTQVSDDGQPARPVPSARTEGRRQRTSVLPPGSIPPSAPPPSPPRARISTQRGHADPGRPRSSTPPPR